MEGFQIKDEIEAEVVNVSQEEKRIGLSVRKLKERSERDIQKNYVNNQDKATSNLGEVLKEKILDLQPKALSDYAAARAEAFPNNIPASTAVSTPVLVIPELLAEVEAVAEIGSGTRT